MNTGWELIIPFLRPLEGYLRDEGVSEILVNGDERVFVEREGCLEGVDVRLSQAALETAVLNLARSLGDDVSEAEPLLDSRLPDGSRVAAVLPPCSLGGITLAIRRFTSQRFTMQDLVERGSLPADVATLLEGYVRDRKNILLSGGTGTGKTTVLGILADAIPDGQRIVLIEDTAELKIRKPNLARLEARRAQGEYPAVTIRDLLRTTLRLRPDRIVVGEVRGAEAFDLLQALNTGHEGTLSTIHASSAQQALPRFTSCVLQSGVELPYKAIKSSIADSLDLVVHISREHGQRFVSEVVEVQGYEPDADRYRLIPIYDRRAARAH